MSTEIFQAQNRVLEPDDCQREPFRSVNQGIADQIEREKAEAGEQLSFVYPSKVWEYPWAITRHPLPEGETVLDAGCGVSALPIYLAARGATVVAIDNDMRWLAMEKRAARFHRVPVVSVLMDMEALAFPDESFDRVYCISVLEHLPPERQPTAMREMARTLVPDGILYLTVDYDEKERRSEDDVVYDRLALQRYGIAPSGLEIEGTTDYSRPDWEQHHHRMRHFKLHTFAAMAVALRKPPAEGPESAAAIAARRARAGEGFFVGIDLGDAAALEPGAITRAAALGARDVRLALGSYLEATSFAPHGVERVKQLQEELRAAAARATWTLIDASRTSVLAGAADAFVESALRPLLDAIDPDLARALVLAREPEAAVEAADWGRVHAFLRAATLAAHALRPALPIAASSGTRGAGAIVEGRFDGAALDAYALDAADPAALPEAGFVSLVRDTFVEIAHGDPVAGVDAVRAKGYRGAFVSPPDAASEGALARLFRG